MNRSLSSAICLASLVVPAYAQPVEDQHARELALYDAGKAYFDIAEYPLAIVKWKEAYLLSNEPLLLFNIAQAYRLSGDCPQANRFYGNYVRVVPKPHNQSELDAAMTKCRGVPAAVGDTTPLTKGDAAATSSTENHPSSPRPLRIAGYVLIGGGVLAGVGAGLFAMSARSDARVIAGQPTGTPFTPQLADTEQAGMTSERRAKLSLAFSITAVVGGGVLWWLGRDRAPMRIDVAVLPQHAEVALTCAF